MKGYGHVKANVVDCPDFAQFIVEHMMDSNVVYNVGGKETYTYEEMADMCFKATDKPFKIKWAPIWLFGILANLPKIKKAGKHDIILFSKWTLSHDLVGELKNVSFKKTDVAKETLAKNNEKKMPIFVLVTIWVSVAVLYVAQVSPMLFRYDNGATDVIVPIVGLRFLSLVLF